MTRCFACILRLKRHVIIFMLVNRLLLLTFKNKDTCKSYNITVSWQWLGNQTFQELLQCLLISFHGYRTSQQIILHKMSCDSLGQDSHELNANAVFSSYLSIGKWISIFNGHSTNVDNASNNSEQI